MIGAARAGRISPLIFAAIAGAWVLAIVAQVSGSGKLVHHDTLIEGGLPFWVALLLFVLAWQAMIAAMMLPSSLPLLALGFRLGPAPRLFNFALDVHTSDTRTLPLSLKANPVRECPARVRARASCDHGRRTDRPRSRTVPWSAANARPSYSARRERSVPDGY